MQGDSGYDTTNLQTLRRALDALNDAALADGLVAARDGVIMTLRRAEPAASAASAKRKETAEKKAATADDRTPAAAARLLALLRRREGDDPSDDRDADFSEAAVARLLTRLRRRSKDATGSWGRFLARSERQLGLPVAFGNRTVQGIGVERLHVFVHQLEDIRASGLKRFSESRAARRNLGSAPPASRDSGPVEPRRKGPSR